jgi:hypothetical protein
MQRSALMAHRISLKWRPTKFRKPMVAGLGCESGSRPQAGKGPTQSWFSRHIESPGWRAAIVIFAFRARPQLGSAGTSGNATLDSAASKHRRPYEKHRPTRNLEACPAHCSNKPRHCGFLPETSCCCHSVSAHENESPRQPRPEPVGFCTNDYLRAASF